jgi:hypothetical protein
MAKASPTRKGTAKGGHPKVRKWEAERRRKRTRQMIPVVFVAAGAIVLLAAAGMLAPPPPSGEGGPCDFPVKFSHTHAQLLIYDDGVLQDVPAEIGVDPDLTFDRSLIACTSGDPDHGAAPVHTHLGEANLLHIESRVDRTYSLGDFFRTWAQPVGPEATWYLRAGATHHLTMTVNGVPSQAWGNLVLEDGMSVRIDLNPV